MPPPTAIRPVTHVISIPRFLCAVIIVVIDDRAEAGL
jgi:hypothetical protein